MEDKREILPSIGKRNKTKPRAEHKTAEDDIFSEESYKGWSSSGTAGDIWGDPDEVMKGHGSIPNEMEHKWSHSPAMFGAINDLPEGISTVVIHAMTVMVAQFNGARIASVEIKEPHISIVHMESEDGYTSLEDYDEEDSYVSVAYSFLENLQSLDELASRLKRAKCSILGARTFHAAYFNFMEHGKKATLLLVGSAQHTDLDDKNIQKLFASLRFNVPKSFLSRHLAVLASCQHIIFSEPSVVSVAITSPWVYYRLCATSNPSLVGLYLTSAPFTDREKKRLLPLLGLIALYPFISELALDISTNTLIRTYAFLTANDALPPKWYGVDKLWEKTVGPYKSSMIALYTKWAEITSEVEEINEAKSISELEKTFLERNPDLAGVDDPAGGDSESKGQENVPDGYEDAVAEAQLLLMNSTVTSGALIGDYAAAMGVSVEKFLIEIQEVKVKKDQIFTKYGIGAKSLIDFNTELTIVEPEALPSDLADAGADGALKEKRDKFKAIVAPVDGAKAEQAHI